MLHDPLPPIGDRGMKLCQSDLSCRVVKNQQPANGHGGAGSLPKIKEKNTSNNSSSAERGESSYQPQQQAAVRQPQRSVLSPALVGCNSFDTYTYSLLVENFTTLPVRMLITYTDVMGMEHTKEVDVLRRTSSTGAVEALLKVHSVDCLRFVQGWHLVEVDEDIISEHAQRTASNCFRITIRLFRYKSGDAKTHDGHVALIGDENRGSSMRSMSPTRLTGSGRVPSKPGTGAGVLVYSMHHCGGNHSCPLSKASGCRDLGPAAATKALRASHQPCLGGRKCYSTCMPVTVALHQLRFPK